MLASDDLDGLYATFNDNPPADYKAHSMSVSDVVIMHQNGETKAFYVDRFGFEELPDFATQRENMLDITPEVENVDWENDITCISFYAAEFIKQQNELLKSKKNNQRIHRMRFKRKKPHGHEEK